MEKELQYKVDSEISGAVIRSYDGFVRINYNYIEIPINLTYKFNGLRFFVDPYIGIGIGGSMKNHFSFRIGENTFDNSNFLSKNHMK